MKPSLRVRIGRLVCRFRGHNPQPWAGPGVWLCNRCDWMTDEAREAMRRG